LLDISGDRVHISVNIEGTTNSSFLAELGGIYGQEQVLVYQLSQKRFVRLSDLQNNPAANLVKFGKDLIENTPLLNQLLPEADEDETGNKIGYPLKDLPSDTAVVHGHFTPNMFQDLFDNPFISIVLRDPLNRMIALFEEWKHKKGKVDWRVTVPYRAKMPFREFALQEDFINFQSKSLGNRRLGDYDLVGVADCQAGFIAQLKNKDWTEFIPPEKNGYKLGKPRYKKLGVTPEFLEEFQEANQLDYSIYRQAKEFMGYC
jgi:hypothetical protein